MYQRCLGTWDTVCEGVGEHKWQDFLLSGNLYFSGGGQVINDIVHK